jgi:hypothetical protein
MPLNRRPTKSLKSSVAEQKAETDRRNAAAGAANDPYDGGKARHPDDFLTADEVCEMVGGRQRPISKPSLYRAIKLGIISPPEHPSPGISRWRYGKTRAEIDARAAAGGVSQRPRGKQCPVLAQNGGGQ